ncbi:hypothetical protein BKA69DRAFT_1094781 [Paraphysoderma sedebokerense]|nr:hypothetical protein BKA69DRAFT_1094781 [Paraphysoderma sedebokerense]
MRENQIFGKTSDNLGLLVQRGFKATDQQLVVVDRLKRVLAELNEKYPQDRWSDFIQINSSNNEKDVKWEKVLAMGHSQGAAIAAFLGSQLQIAGVRQFAGPSDVYSDGVTAGYITMPSATTKSLW